MKNGPYSRGVLLSYLAVYVIWGSTYLAIKWGVETIPPFYLVGMRFFAGGLAFILAAAVTGRMRSLPTPRQILSAAFLGTFLIILGNGLVSWAEKEVDSYIASLIVSSTPFCIALFNRALFRERLTRVRLAGMILGLSGVALILYRGSGSFVPGAPWLLVLGGFVCWSFATSTGHRLPVHPDNLVNSGMQMLFAGAAALIGSHFFYGPLPSIATEVTVRSWAGLAYLTVFGALGFYAYNYLLAHEPAIRISSYAIVNPLIAACLGLFLGNEKPSAALFLGMPVILLGLAFMMYGEQILSLFKRTPDAQAAQKDSAFDSTLTEEL